MTRILLIIIALTMAFSNSLSASNEIMSADFIFNLGNDKDFVLVGSDGYRDRLVVSEINIETNKINHYVIDDDYYTIEFVTVNSVHQKIAIKSAHSNRIYIYHYGTSNLLSTLVLDSVYNNFAFSKDGDYLYTVSPTNNFFNSYDVITGEITKEFDLVGALKQKYFYIDTENEEITVYNGSAYDIWSITEEKIVRSGNGYIPFILDKLLSDGALKAYMKNGTFYIDSTSNGTNIISKKFFENNDYLSYFFYCNYCKLDVTSDMKYMLLNYSEREQIIYDIVNDSIIKLATIIVDGYEERPPYVHAINSDFTKSIVSYDKYWYCGRYLEIPMQWNKFFIYDNVQSKNSSSIPKGYVDGIARSFYSDNSVAVIGDNLEKVIIYNEDTKVLIDKEENFLRYIDIDATPVILYNNSTKIGVLDSNVFRTYNLTTNKYEKEFEVDINNILKVYFPQNQDVILFQDSNKAYVYDFNKFSQLKEFDFGSLGIKPDNLKFDGNKFIVASDSSTIYKYDIYNGEQTVYKENESFKEYLYKDFSTDGEHLLYFKSPNKVLKHNLRTGYLTEDTLLGQSFEYGRELTGIGFLGNHELVWYIYLHDPTQRGYYRSNIYDFTTKAETSMAGEFKPIISDNGKMYIGRYCPDDYFFRAIRDPQSSVETTTTITGSVYPNPASDFIKIDMNASAMNSSIEIFDVYGKQVMSAIYTGEDIDISSLTAGVYFAKVGGKSWKFIKL
ncbi:MAG: T9SS type A sorting domain-containing protein [Ignavibacteriae bacterium]|nr:T9SS type A sorting domain-containing protein [Ignavibacteriota bacterium]